MCKENIIGKCKEFCPVCAKNEIYDLNEKLKLKELIIYFLGIDENFVYELCFTKKVFKEKTNLALKFRSRELDNAFFKACARMRKILEKFALEKKEYCKDYNDFLVFLDQIEDRYSIKKAV